jgi:hypothetical protein
MKSSLYAGVPWNTHQPIWPLITDTSSRLSCLSIHPFFTISLSSWLHVFAWSSSSGFHTTGFVCRMSPSAQFQQAPSSDFSLISWDLLRKALWIFKLPFLSGLFLLHKDSVWKESRELLSVLPLTTSTLSPFFLLSSLLPQDKDVESQRLSYVYCYFVISLPSWEDYRRNNVTIKMCNKVVNLSSSLYELGCHLLPKQDWYHSIFAHPSHLLPYYSFFWNNLLSFRVPPLSNFQREYCMYILHVGNFWNLYA